MKIIRVSDKQKNCRYLEYVAKTLHGKNGLQFNLYFQHDRAILNIQTTENKEKALKSIIIEKIAEVICIGYKYEYLKKNIKIVGLHQEDIEIFFAFIIAADFPKERRYLIAYLSEMDEHTIDGFYKFRLLSLQKKWKKVVDCLPSYFSKEQLINFAKYIIQDRNRKVFLNEQNVYDSGFRLLRRADLIEEDSKEIKTLREIILSCAGKVECLKLLSSKQKSFFESYYCDRVIFK